MSSIYICSCLSTLLQFWDVKEDYICYWQTNFILFFWHHMYMNLNGRKFDSVISWVWWVKFIWTRSCWDKRKIGEDPLWKWTPMLPNVPRMEDFHCYALRFYHDCCTPSITITIMFICLGICPLIRLALVPMPM